MRNLKRVLSLALALVMVLGMMVITTSAADYTDAEEITYTEAVEVMSAIGILKGEPNADGTFTFNPTGTLTRAQAAKIIAFVCMGTEADEYLTGSIADPFDDVKATSWAAKYVAFCKNAEIINGVGNNKFNPAGNVTTVQFAKMLLGALGIEGTFTGAGWENNVKDAVAEVPAMDATGIKIDNSDISREEACELALAAMKVPTTVSGTYYKLTVSETESYKFETQNDALLYKVLLGDAAADAKITGPHKDTSGSLLETVYKWNYNTVNVADDFGRPAVSYDNGKTGAQKVELLFVDEADYTYTVTGANDTKLAQIAAKLELTVADATMVDAVKGDTVELYLNADGKIATAVKLHTELAKITKVVAPTDKDAKYAYTVSMSVGGYPTSYKDTELEGFDAETMVKNTTVTLVKGDGVAIIAEAEYITGKQTATGTGYIKVDGVKMSYVDGALTGVNYADTFKFFVANGLIIGNEKVVEAAVETETNVFYITDSYFDAGNTWTADIAKISVTHLDGTSEILDMAITTKAATPGVKYVNKDTVLNDETEEKLYGAGFYAYTLTEDGEVATVAAITDKLTKHDGFVQLLDGQSVTFYKGEARILWKNTNLYATNSTTVTAITSEGVKTVTGYANFLADTFTGTTLAKLDENDDVVAVYVIGDSFGDVVVVGDEVIGVYISTGETTQDATTKKYYTEVVYNVAGEDVTYTIEGKTVAAKFQGFVEITVTDGVAALAETDAVVTNKAVTKVTDSYILVKGARDPIYFAADVAYYDVTDVAKNGVVADDGVAVGDIICYTMDKKGEKIAAVYTAYEAQEDGVIAFDKDTDADKAYYTEVLGLNVDALAGIGDHDYVIVQYSRPADATSFGLKYWLTTAEKPEDAIDITSGWDGTEDNTGVLFYDEPVGTYRYEILVDGDVALSGAFELTK